MNRFGRWTLPALAAGVLSVPEAALPQDVQSDEALRKRVEELDSKVRSLEEKLEQAQQRGAKPVPSATTPAATANGTPDLALQKRVDEIDQQVKIVSRKQEIDQEAAAEKAKEAPVVFIGGKEGYGFRSADGAYKVRFGALLQADARAYFDNDSFPNPQPDNFLLRRLRTVMDATFNEKYSLLIRMEFGNQDAISLLDGYLDARYTPQFRLRIGKFKGPVGLERLQSPQDLVFVERGFPTQLLPNRDIGFQVYGDVFGGRLTYQAAYTDGVRDNSSTDTDNNSAKDFNGRLFAHPFRLSDIESLQGLGLGIAWTIGAQSGTPTSGNLPTYVTPGQQTFFAYSVGTYAAGDRQRWSPQFYYYNGPLGVLGEYATITQDITRTTNHGAITNTAWQLYVNWVLTGEDAGYTRPTPRQNFDWNTGGWGAFDVGVRVSQLTVDQNVFVGSATTRFANPVGSAQQATDVGLVLNWNLNRHVKVVLNYDQTRFKGGGPNGTNLPDEKVLVTRFQAWF
jgi:phosphate-selective porin OprO/OprP